MKVFYYLMQKTHESGKTHNTVGEMKRPKNNILGIRLPKTGVMRIEDHDFYYSGNNDARHLNGVGFLVRCLGVCLLQINIAG